MHSLILTTCTWQRWFAMFSISNKCWQLRTKMEPQFCPSVIMIAYRNYPDFDVCIFYLLVFLTHPNLKYLNNSDGIET